LKTDADSFAAWCGTDLHITPNIVSTKRLGRIACGKTQPLLVVLFDVEQARQLTGSAKLLRRSLNETTRQKVYINPHLTRAEATAAYQVRVQRRQAMLVRRQKNTDISGGVISGSSEFSASFRINPVNGVLRQPTSPITPSSSSLNPSADSFAPLASATDTED
jgi:hypothetical protein